jgi:hypothetical protein
MQNLHIQGKVFNSADCRLLAHAMMLAMIVAQYGKYLCVQLLLTCQIGFLRIYQPEQYSMVG